MYDAICQCSFSRGINPDSIETTGAISIMRTFGSTGRMNKSLYHMKDPFCRKRTPEGLEYGLELFFSRLLIVKDLMHTKTAKKIAKKRTKILYKFIHALKQVI